MKKGNSIKIGYDERKIEILTLIEMYNEITRDKLYYYWRISNPGNKSDFLSLIKRYIKTGLIGVKNVYFTPARTKKGRKKINCTYYLTNTGKARLNYLLYKRKKEEERLNKLKNIEKKQNG